MPFGHLYVFFGEMYLDLLPIFKFSCLGFFDIELHKLFTYFEIGMKKECYKQYIQTLDMSFIKAEKPHLLEEVVYFDSGFTLKLFMFSKHLQINTSWLLEPRPGAQHTLK